MNVLILGAKSDVANAFAYACATKGYHIILAARNSNELEHTRNDIALRHKVNVWLVEFNATDYESHTTFYANLPARPDMVLCAFGYLGDHAKALSDSSEAINILQTNYVGAASILNVVANDFEQRKAGTIIGISSVAGDRGRKSNYMYGSAKAGLTAFLSGLRNRLYASNVHVLTVLPGFINTAMTKDLPLPPAITASPQEVAKDILTAAEKKKNIIYTKWFWRYIMMIIKNIPEPIFKRLSL